MGVCVRVTFCFDPSRRIFCPSIHTHAHAQIAAFIQRRGRLSVAELARESNKLIDLAQAAREEAARRQREEAAAAAAAAAAAGEGGGEG